MTKKARTLYNLRIDDFDSVVENFAKSKKELEVTRETQENHIMYRFKYSGEKRPSSNLHCYISQARVSFYCDGKSKDLAEECQKEIIELTELKIGESKTFSVKKVSQEEVDAISAFLCEDCECNREDIVNDNPTIISSFKITGKYEDSIRVTLYKNDTLLVQGRPCITFNNFIEIASELFNPAVVKKEHLKLFDISEGDEVINSNLSEHLPNAYEHIGPKLDAIMAPSLILLNNAKKLSDYSACSFPVLRGTEGVMKSIFNNEGIPLNDFGEYFKFDHKTKNCEWNKNISVLFPNEAFRNKLLALYRFYYAHRHTTFHVDATIEGSRTLEYDEALSIVIDGLKLINEVYCHLN